MKKVLFVSNGHGEAAIASRLASELRGTTDVVTHHFGLVGEPRNVEPFAEVGPHKAMPSGGLVAMGNVRAFSADVRSGFVALWNQQRRFLARDARVYDRVIAVGDVYALGMSFFVRKPITFVGTAKSVYVAKYGPFERRLLSLAEHVFVRDEPTAVHLRQGGVNASAPGNVIVDLLDVGDPLPAPDPPMIALFPGSRTSAYQDAVRLSGVARVVLRERRQYSAVLSVAPTLSLARVIELLRADGWNVDESDPVYAFRATSEGITLHGGTGELAPLLRLATIVVGQAGTGNEAAAAAGVPVVALAPAGKIGWYRMRQERLLGEALLVVRNEIPQAVPAVLGLIDSPERRERMSAVGRERMGAAGGARIIARAIADRLAR